MSFLIFFNTLSAAGFLPCISVPTGITATSRTLIDHFFCNDVSLMSHPSVILSDLSDHLPIAVTLKMKTECNETNKQREMVLDFRRIDSLRARLSQRLNNVHEMQDAERSCDFLTKVLSEEISAHSVKKPSRRTVPIQPWISYELLRKINMKNELHKKYIHSPTEVNLANFKTYKNNLTTLIKE